MKPKILQYTITQVKWVCLSVSSILKVRMEKCLQIFMGAYHIKVNHVIELHWGTNFRRSGGDDVQWDYNNTK